MSVDRVARSVALEQAYVYDVYEQLNDSCNCSKPWPKVQEFLAGLENGSIVCDVGSGNGKYLNVNAHVYTIGGDRSTKLCDMTRTARESEVVLLDNLSLPYRDESLDGVLSIAVIHHFATTERRVCALRELARVLRIGGRIIISVWAMERSSRRFESQDVLVPVPWTGNNTTNHSCNTYSATANMPPLTTTDMLIDYHDHCSMMLHNDLQYYETSKSTTNSKRKVKSNNHHNNKTASEKHLSPVNSTLSSPNETCYSFVRKAIQKLASGHRPSPSSSQRRPWFLDVGWGNCAKDLKTAVPNKGTRYDPDGCECECEMFDVQDLPIELRRVDLDDLDLTDKHHFLRLPAPSSQNNSKSQSMSNMSETTVSTNISCDSSTSNSIKHLTKPKKLVKQKQSICLDHSEEEALDQHTDMLTMRKQRPVLKQRSLNEEQLGNSNVRSLEKEKLKHHLHKQTSLNDDLMYQRHTDHIKDSFFSSRLHLIKTGFANKLKTSTTNIEKVASSSFKNGFVKILQNWKPFDNISNSAAQQQQVLTNSNVDVELLLKRDCADGCERRLSKEEGSDSSKDSSLQSDTSVDSEDSFASVIFIPRSNSISPTLSPGLTSPKMLNYSVPTSPKIKQSSCPTSPRIRQMPLTIYPPLTKQVSSPKPTLKDNTIRLQQIQHVQDSIKDSVTTAAKSLATKYSVQQIPKFNKKNPADLKVVDGSIETSKSKYPMVRHGGGHMSLCNGKHNIVKPLPKLLSLDLFNPETDDKDSDSSAVSSPDSVDSVVNVQHKKKLLQAAVDVANSLDETMVKIIRSNKSQKSTVATSSSSGVLQQPATMERAFDVSPVEPEDCQRHLEDFADRLTEKLQREITRYQQTKNLHGVSYQDPYINRLSEELYDLSKLSAEIQKQNEYLAKLSVSDELELVVTNNWCYKCRKCKCKCDNSGKSSSSGNIATDKPTGARAAAMKAGLRSTPSIDSCCGENVAASGGSNNSMCMLGAQQSTDSADYPEQLSNSSGYSINSSANTAKCSAYSAYGGSTASLASCPEWKTPQRNILKAAERSASSDCSERDRVDGAAMMTTAPHSGVTSQESLPSDGGTVGGEITYHRFYHVFRERELDQLIEKYVDNLHIISSYYDHASWCIVAEKVHVWTI